MNSLELRAARLVMGFTIEDMAKMFDVRVDSWRSFEKPSSPGAPGGITEQVEGLLGEFTRRAETWLEGAMEDERKAVLYMYRDEAELRVHQPDWHMGARQWTSWVAYCYALAIGASLDPWIEKAPEGHQGTTYDQKFGAHDG